MKALETKLTTKQRMFLKEYFKTGNGTQSAMKVYDCKNEQSAAEIASQTLRKLKVDIATLMEAKGLSMGKLIDVVSDATEANKIHGTDDNFIEIADHPTRLKAVEIASKWLGVKQEDNNNVKRRIVAEEFFGD